MYSVTLSRLLPNFIPTTWFYSEAIEERPILSFGYQINRSYLLEILSPPFQGWTRFRWEKFSRRSRQNCWNVIDSSRYFVFLEPSRSIRAGQRPEVVNWSHESPFVRSSVIYGNLRCDQNMSTAHLEFFRNEKNEPRGQKTFLLKSEKKLIELIFLGKNMLAVLNCW